MYKLALWPFARSVLRAGPASGPYATSGHEAGFFVTFKLMNFLKNFFFLDFHSHIKDSKWAENVFLSIVQAVTEVLNKSHFSLQMGNYPIPVAEDSGLYHLLFNNK